MYCDFLRGPDKTEVSYLFWIVPETKTDGFQLSPWKGGWGGGGGGIYVVGGGEADTEADRDNETMRKWGFFFSWKSDKVYIIRHLLKCVWAYVVTLISSWA